MTSSSVPPVRQRLSQSDPIEYSRASGPSTQSLISRAARLVIAIPSIRSAGVTVRAR